MDDLNKNISDELKDIKKKIFTELNVLQKHNMNSMIFLLNIVEKIESIHQKIKSI